MQQKNLDMLNLDDLWIQASRFDTPTERLTDPIPVLFQSGYLTIKGYEKNGKLYHLCFPNYEVRQGFSESLVWYYTAQDMKRYDAIVYAYSKNVLINDDMGAFMPHLKAFYDKFPYTIINNNERHYQAVMFTIFTMLGEDVKVEHTTSDGRIDLVLKTDKSIFIFELKYEKSANAAMAQISGKDYAKAFADDGRKVVKVAVNFSEDQRSIEDWVIE
ncbi:PD-(D/E)XK nuclease domain-containing protein [Segatella hominis]|uniref:PD-(D/E)XK nuclease domain-containing protein n=1 Tax=Segatella hominis TaxID=2518605 RepID=UPI002114AB13|nr:PD-(D/E)XK nuclease domain-containing protein [Segatella hominis]WOZ80267.1 PD-(D/E)XK nuclease domain-containing protein [Segatella hominis]